MGRGHVLDVKLRSSQVRATRMRLAAVALTVTCGAVLGLYALWRVGGWALDQLVYENKTFAIQQMDIQTDGVILPDQLRRWSGVKPGENLLALDLARVKRDLELSPLVKSASVERVLPGTLRIRVSERQPIARVNVPHPLTSGGFDIVVFQLDEEGYVLQPLGPGQRAVPLTQADDELPVVLGMNLSELQPGRRIEAIQTQAALKFIQAFNSSPMAGSVDLKYIDVHFPQVLVVGTSQRSEITFSLDDFDKQLRRWKKVYEECNRQNKIIGALDLAVSDNTPLRFMDAGDPPAFAPKNAKPHNKKKNV